MLWISLSSVTWWTISRRGIHSVLRIICGVLSYLVRLSVYLTDWRVYGSNPKSVSCRKYLVPQLVNLLAYFATELTTTPAATAVP